MTTILSSLAWGAYAIGFFFWAISIKMEKQKEIKAKYAALISYIVSLIFWVTHYIVK